MGRTSSCRVVHEGYRCINAAAVAVHVSRLEHDLQAALKTIAKKKGISMKMMFEIMVLDLIQKNKELL